MFFPINKDKRPQGTSWVTLSLIVINSLIWIGLALTGQNEWAIQHYGLRPAHWTVITLYTHMFLHAGILHVGGNMWFLWMFAPKLEERLGRFFFLIYYFACGFGAVAFYILLTHSSNIPLVGASGAISGVAGLYFVLFPRSPFNLVLYLGWFIRKSFAVQTRGAVGAWLGEQLVLGLISSGFGSTGIAFWAHVGGFLSGALLALAIVSNMSAEEKEQVFKPAPLTIEERDEINADYVEQKSNLTSLKLN